jgi:hypothetical protein
MPMSYPPPPSGPEDPNAQQPPTGEQPPPPPPPPYGQQPLPAYPQQPPAYGQQPPAYGQQPPAYGQPGYPVNPYGAPAPYGATRGNSKALWGMICGIVGVLFCGIILGIVAIVLGNQAKSEIAASQGTQTGEGQAKAAVILGIVDLVLSVLLIAVVVASNS